MPGRSSRSAGATYLDREKRLRELKEAARRASGRVSEIRHVWLFGSLVSGVPTVRSDADILVEVASSAHSDPKERLPEILAAFRPLPCPLDIFVRTSEEIARDADRSPLLREALAPRVDLLVQ